MTPYQNLRSTRTYHIGAKYPEDIINKESTKEDTASHDIVKMQKLDTIDSKGKAKEIIGNPVLFHEVPYPNDTTENQGDHIMSCELIFEDFFIFNYTGSSEKISKF